MSILRLTTARVTVTIPERPGQLHCEKCDLACGFTEQPALEMFQGMYLCPYCITDIIRANKKSLKELRDKLDDL